MNTETQGRVDMHVLGTVTDQHYMGTMGQAEIKVEFCSTRALKPGRDFRFIYDPADAPMFEKGDKVGLRLKGNRFLGFNVIGIFREVNG